MNYIYDILLNFNDYAYDIFEWNKEDKITHIRKIPLIKTKNTTLYNLVNNKIKFSEKFLKKIYQKAEDINHKKIDYAFLCTDGKMVVAILIEKNKVKYSQLFQAEEEEVLEFSFNLKKIDIEYQILSNNIIDYKKTRNEQYMKKFIYSQLKKIKDIDKINFLYLECFNKKSDNALNDLYYELDNNYENIYIKLYKLLKSTLIKK